MAYCPPLFDEKTNRNHTASFLACQQKNTSLERGQKRCIDYM